MAETDENIHNLPRECLSENPYDTILALIDVQRASSMPFQTVLSGIHAVESV